jgi:hypothetical protein
VDLKIDIPKNPADAKTYGGDRHVRNDNKHGTWSDKNHNNCKVT